MDSPISTTPADPRCFDVDPHGIGIRFGDFYARRLIEALDLAPNKGVVRVSIAHYNTAAEIDLLIEKLAGAILRPA